MPNIRRPSHTSPAYRPERRVAKVPTTTAARTAARKPHRNGSMTDSRWNQLRRIRAATIVAAIEPPVCSTTHPAQRGAGLQRAAPRTGGMSQRQRPAHPPRHRPRVRALRVDLVGLLPRSLTWIPLRRACVVADIYDALRIRAVAG